MANKPKVGALKIQAKIDALKIKREGRLAKADKAFEKARREAVERHNKSYKEAVHDFDSKIAKLEEKRAAADREARQVWGDPQKSQKAAKA